MKSFIAELKRRNVFKVGAAYAIVAWLLIQITDIVAPALHLPEWTVTLIVYLLLIGFPLALFLAWAYELTPVGIKPSREVDEADSITHSTGQKFNVTLIGLLVLVIVFLILDNYVLREDRSQESEVRINNTSVSTVSTETQLNDKGPVTRDKAGSSIAVLPFTNLSDDKANEYFADGIAEEILNSLARIRELEVRGRTSSFYFKGRNEDFATISRMLNVKYLLEGSVRKAGEQVRITVQLIDTQTADHLWSKTYERTLNDIFAIQEDVARSVADTLQITLGVGELGRSQGMTRNTEAYDAYLEGRSLISRLGQDNLETGIEQLERSVMLDPDFVLAWTVLVGAYTVAAVQNLTESGDEYAEKADQAATRAIALAPESIPSLLADASQKVFKHDWALAEQLYKKVIYQVPNDYETNLFYGYFLMDVGRSTEAIVVNKLAVKSEPLFIRPIGSLGLSHEMSGNLEDAFKTYQKGNNLIGDKETIAQWSLIAALELGDHALIESLKEKMKDDIFVPLMDSSQEARIVLHSFYTDPKNKNPSTLSVLSVWASYFGDHALALQAYQDASKYRNFFPAVLWRPIHKEMRRLPGFKDIVRDIGLVEYWRSTGNWGEFCRPAGEDDFECQ